MRYNVTIQETLARTVQVEAGSQRDAELAVRQLYRDCEIILSADDYVETSITVRSCHPYSNPPTTIDPKTIGSIG